VTTPVKSLLFCFAHPDDESFSAAGTAMKYAERGVRSVLVTATRGERGSVGDPPVCTAEELAAVREKELRHAASIIGFDELHLLDYVDRRLAEAPPDEIRRSLVSILRRVRPSIVFTFDPNGFNLHPDHVAVSRFASDAIAAAADPRWFPDAGEPHAVTRLLWTPLLGPWDMAAGDPFELQPGADFVIDVAPWRERRAAALRAHRTQHASVARRFWNQPDPDRILATEIWRQAWGPPLRRHPESDLLV
jgi:LmbE family N-acetylglucosaminyl deacetylase